MYNKALLITAKNKRVRILRMLRRAWDPRFIGKLYMKNMIKNSTFWRKTIIRSLKRNQTHK